MRKFLVLIALCIFTYSESNAQVSNSSYTTQYGEKVLQFSVTVPMSKKEAWKLFTTDEGLVKWMAPVAKIDMKTGGYIKTNYDKSKSIDDNTSIRLDIINYLEYEMLTLKVNLNENFPAEAKNEDKNLQEVIQFTDAGNGNTKIISSMLGWGHGSHWDKTYSFFELGNDLTFKEFLKLF
jgi:hypothetical protein